VNVVMTLLVRNEADIIEQHLEYHLHRGVDFFIATDNLSDDGTRDVLERYRQRGLLHLLVETEDIYAQSEWVTRMARLAHGDFRADWVINSDADEFWWPEEAEGLGALFAAVPLEIAALRVPRTNFVPLSRTSSVDPVEAMTVRERESNNAIGQPLPAKVCHRAYADIEVEMGNHGARRITGSFDAGTAALTIFHFPLRSLAQLVRKISLGGAALERNTALHPEIVKTWRVLYHKWQLGELESFYDEQVPDAAEIAAGLASGRLVRDERLRDFMRGVRGLKGFS